VTFSTSCNVCRHARLAEADAALAARRTDASVARLLGLKKDAVRRHRLNHLAVAPPETRAASTDPAASAAAVLRDAMNGLRGIDTTTMSGPAKTAHMDALRRAAESLSRVEEPSPPSDDGRPTWEALRAMWAEMFLALEPFPEARMALAKVMRAKIGKQEVRG
jgi:hypothetical protein